MLANLIDLILLRGCQIRGHIITVIYRLVPEKSVLQPFCSVQPGSILQRMLKKCSGTPVRKLLFTWIIIVVLWQAWVSRSLEQILRMETRRPKRKTALKMEQIHPCRSILGPCLSKNDCKQCNYKDFGLIDIRCQFASFHGSQFTMAIPKYIKQRGVFFQTEKSIHFLVPS